jgi:hypothetical protein
MVDKKSPKKKKAPKKDRTELRFVPEPMYITPVAVVLGAVGCVMLGAGVFAQWIREVPGDYAPYLLAIGAAALGAALWVGNIGIFPVRVGDAGVAMERGPEVSRLAWCELDKVRLERQELKLIAERMTFTIPVRAHPMAVSYIVQEVERRLPSLLDAPETERKQLAPYKEGEGEATPVKGLQVAGSRCAASSKLISFERDARLCPNCGQVYHHEHVPKKCTTCETELTGRAVTA